MSYGIIRIQKFKKNDVRGIQSHDNRERKSHSNPDIDPAKSELNFSLIECQNQNFSDAIRKNFEALSSTKAVRKDAVVMVQCLVTSDHDFFKNKIPDPDEQRNFFEQSLAFISDRYGRRNIISATVHLDEKTPHMHVNLTPIKNQKLSAKSIFDRAEFRNLHTDFYRAVGKKWGLERGENREEKRRHLDTAAFKIETSRAELERAKQAEKDQRERVRFYQAQAVEAEKVLQEDLKIPQGVFNRKSSLAKAMEQINLLKKSLADKHIIEGENHDLRSKVESLTAQNSSLESKNKENEKSLLTLRKQYEDECSKNKDIAKFFTERQDIEFTFSFWQQMQKAAVKQEEKRQRETGKKATSEWFVKTLPKPDKPLEEDKKQEKLQKKNPAEQEKPVLAAPDMDLDKERRRLDRVFSEALRNTSGTAWDHMKQVKKLLEQWEKTPDRDSFERQTLSQLQDLPRQNDRGR